MSALLLDASVWVATFDPEDRYNVAAQELIARGAGLNALDLTLYEVANVALNRWKAPDDARLLVRLVCESCLAVTTVDDQLADAAIALADEHNLSMYDAAYVAAAKRNGWTLVSADHRDLVRPGLAITPAEAAT
jgi:predicted nucleic acid-binding protein